MNAETCTWQQTLSPKLLALIDPNLPVAARLPVAQGLAPLPPRDLIAALCALRCEPLPQLHTAAQASLESLPDSLLLPVVQGETPPLVLATLLAALSQRPALMEKLLINRATPDAALAGFAALAPAAQAEMLAADQERCLRCEALVRALCQNDTLLHSSRDRLFDFLVRAGVLYADMPEVAEAVARLSGTQMQAAMAAVALPSEVASLLCEDASATSAAAETAAAQAGGPPADAPDASDAPEASDAPADDAARLPMLKRINTMNMAQKVALATRGNKEARAILLRDANRVVAVAAIKNPRITDQEVQAAARSRSVHEDVIRIIANSRDMTRSYGVKMGLVQNPKAPLPVSMRLLTSLRAPDLKAISKSKGLPQALVSQARKLLTSKDAGS